MPQLRCYVENMSLAERSGALSPQALVRLLESRQQFLGFLRKRVGSEEVAEDILQSAFVKGIEKGGSIRDAETVVAWFYRLLRNTVIDYYRQTGSSENALGQLANEMQAQQDPDVSFAGEICGCVTGVMATLKPEYRQALDTVELQERGLAELAAEAHITPNNAAVRVHRAREALRMQVKLACGVCATHGCADCSCRPRS